MYTSMRELYREKCRYIGFARNDFKSSLTGCQNRLWIAAVKSITVLMRWRRVHHIPLNFHKCGDTSHSRSSSDEMQMARYVDT